MDVEQIKQISEVSKRERWPYPRTFQAWRDAGVASYRTSLIDQSTVFYGTEGVEFEEAARGGVSLAPYVGATFDEDAVRYGLAHHQQHRTPYSDFLKDMAAAGVRYYVVDMEQEAISYTSGDPGEAYWEAISVE